MNVSGGVTHGGSTVVMLAVMRQCDMVTVGAAAAPPPWRRLLGRRAGTAGAAEGRGRVSALAARSRGRLWLAASVWKKGTSLVSGLAAVRCACGGDPARHPSAKAWASSRVPISVSRCEAGVWCA